jgi:hypothetical protein
VLRRCCPSPRTHQGCIIRHMIHTPYDIRHTTYDHLKGISPPYEPHTSPIRSAACRGEVHGQCVCVHPPPHGGRSTLLPAERDAARHTVHSNRICPGRTCVCARVRHAHTVCACVCVCAQVCCGVASAAVCSDDGAPHLTHARMHQGCIIRHTIHTTYDIRHTVISTGCPHRMSPIRPMGYGIRHTVPVVWRMVQRWHARTPVVPLRHPNDKTVIKPLSR